MGFATFVGPLYPAFTLPPVLLVDPPPLPELGLAPSLFFVIVGPRCWGWWQLRRLLDALYIRSRLLSKFILAWAWLVTILGQVTNPTRSLIRHSRFPYSRILQIRPSERALLQSRAFRLWDHQRIVSAPISRWTTRQTVVSKLVKMFDSATNHRPPLPLARSCWIRHQISIKPYERRQRSSRKNDRPAPTANTSIRPSTRMLRYCGRGPG